MNDGIEDMLEKAKDLRIKKRYTDAIEVYDQIIINDKSCLLAYNGRSSVYFFLNQYKEAFSDLEFLMKLQPESAGPHYKKGEFLIAMGKYKEAISPLKIVLEKSDPWFSGSVEFLLALSYYKLGNMESAKKYLQNVPDDFRTWINLPDDIEKEGRLITKEDINVWIYG